MFAKLWNLLRYQRLDREQRGLPPLETLTRDVRLSIRSMRRTPALTLAVLGTLAIGIGANTAIFTVINGVLIKPLPYPDADRLVSISLASHVMRIADLESAPYVYLTQRDQSRTLERVGLWNLQAVNVSGREAPERAMTLRVTADILPALGIDPLFGRYFTPADDEPRRRPTAVLMYGYWQRLFGGDRSVVGQTVTLDGTPHDIIGVMPRRFRFLDERSLDLIVPVQLDRAQVFAGGFGWPSLGRLKPGVPIEQADADLARLLPLAADAFPIMPGFTRAQLDGGKWVPVVLPLKQDVVGDAGNTLWVVMGTLGLVLLVACANVANLILVRTEGRQRELAVRAALGASWKRLARGLLTESIVLGLAGGAVGVAVAYVGLRVLLALGSSTLPRMDEIGIDRTVLLFAGAVSFLSALLFGLLPVLRYARPQLSSALRSETRGASGSREHLRARGVLVVVQVALALALLVSAGLMIRTFRELGRVEPGFTQPDAIQTLRVTIPPSSQSDAELTARRQQAILDGIAALPGVESAAYASELPLQSGAGWTDLLVMGNGRMSKEGGLPQNRAFHMVSPGFFATMGTSLVAGRDFSWTDVYERRAVAMISEDLARSEWGSPTEALGKPLRGGSNRNIWREVVGVVGNVHNRGMSEPAGGTVYLPALTALVADQPPLVARSVSYVLRSDRTGTRGFLSDVQRAVWAVDPALPLADVRTMGDYYDDSLARTSLTLVLLGVAAAMALLLGVIGIYGVVSYAVSQRTREVGIRLALGAPRSEIGGMFLRQGLALTLVGVALGLAGAVGLARWMSVLLYGVSPLDPATYAGVSLILIATTLLATYVPSRRATRLDPNIALRVE
ncbi:MAG TPA: ABC transporter permease [Vicinamibacterales bacterium]|nr:ABC transporter permease [Vicinamibacterales bacterium]